MASASIAVGLAALSKGTIAPHLVDIEVPFSTRRRGVEMKIFAGDREPAQDRALVRALQNAHRWAALVKSGTGLREIAQAERRSESYVARIIPLATLSPRIQDAIVSGTQPLDLSLEAFVRQGLPLEWSEQERRFGFAV